VLDGRARSAVAQAFVDARRVQWEVLADAAGVDGDPRVLADEVVLAVRDLDVLVNRLEDALAGNGGFAPTGIGERVAQVLRDVLQRPDVEVRRRVLESVEQAASG
jgi:hypothetical protein